MRKTIQWIFILAVFTYLWTPTLVHAGVMLDLLDDSTAENIMAMGGF